MHEAPARTEVPQLLVCVYSDALVPVIEIGDFPVSVSALCPVLVGEADGLRTTGVAVNDRHRATDAADDRWRERSSDRAGLAGPECRSAIIAADSEVLAGGNARD